MPNNTRSKIRNKISQSQKLLATALGNLEIIIEYYDESNQDAKYIIECVQFCLETASQNEGVEPMQIYREMVRQGHMLSLGKYDQHLFNIISIQLALKATYDGLSEFLIWETQI